MQLSVLQSCLLPLSPSKLLRDLHSRRSWYLYFLFIIMTSFLTRIFSLFALLLFVVFLCAPAFAGDCSRTIPSDDGWKIQEYLKGCDPKGSIVTDDYTIEG